MATFYPRTEAILDGPPENHDGLIRGRHGLGTVYSLTTSNASYKENQPVGIERGRSLMAPPSRGPNDTTSIQLQGRRVSSSYVQAAGRFVRRLVVYRYIYALLRSHVSVFYCVSFSAHAPRIPALTPYAQSRECQKSDWRWAHKTARMTPTIESSRNSKEGSSVRPNSKRRSFPPHGSKGHVSPTPFGDL